MGQLLAGFIQDESQDMQTRQWVFKYYGSSSRAIYTLFEVTLAGCWPNYFRTLVHEVSGYWVLFAIIYITFVVFAVIRIITAIFLKETLFVAQSDAEMMIRENWRMKE